MDPSSPPSVKHATSTISQVSRPGVKKGIVTTPMTGGTTVVASKNLTQLNPELIATSWCVCVCVGVGGWEDERMRGCVRVCVCV